MTTTTIAAWAGPLPNPADLEHYNRIFPDCAQRILAMAERQAAHRQELEKAVLDGNLRQAQRGQYIGAALAALATLGGVYLLINGKDIQGYVTLVANAATFASIYVLGKRSQQKELGTKRQGS